jgi:murein DD-endopeptidase MepM/ murein hydrolase activator NlpD
VPLSKSIAEIRQARGGTQPSDVAAKGRKNAAHGACRGSALLAVVLLAALPLGAGQEAPARSRPASSKSWLIRWQPTQLVNGAPVIFRAKPPVRLESLSGKWLGHEVFFSYDAAARTWYGIAGVSLETRPGLYPLLLNGATARGSQISFQAKLRVRPAKYRSVSITVSKQFTEPSREQLERINQEKTVKQELFQRMVPEREWSGPFRPPVDAPISDVFGTRRTFNGKVQSVHQGLDYAVPQGTAISALNKGTVLLARPLFFEGNCVVLDHGQGLLTLYLHLSEIEVKEGDSVARGQQIGLSGGTGRATGPHLHIAVRWQGVYLNPATLLNLKLP